ncbi:MAG: hypothetical protein HRU77_03615 [Gammaproteobacteria bacterium]|nr:MAG: hypothetical protein HRU77_03615 [Gammaproteobacteria bacterium]
MGLFDWFTSLFSSKNDEEHKASENDIGRDDDNDQVDSDSAIHDAHEIEPERIESEVSAQASGEADTLCNDDEAQRQV